MDFGKEKACRNRSCSKLWKLSILLRGGSGGAGLLGGGGATAHWRVLGAGARR